MTLTLYPTAATISGFAVSSLKGAWDNTAGHLGWRRLLATKSGSNATTSPAVGSAATDWDVAIASFMSDPIASTGTLSGLVQAVLGFRESNANLNAVMHIHIWVTQGDSNTVRGTLLSDYIGPTEFTTATPGIGYAIPKTIVTPVAVQAGDRIVVEIGYRADSTGTTTYTASFYRGGTTADLAQNGDASASPGWIDFIGLGSGLTLDPAPLAETLTDDFNDGTIDTTKWPDNFGTGQSESGGKARITPTATLAGWGSEGIYTLKDSSVLVQMTPPSSPSGATFALARLTIYSSTAYQDYAWIAIDSFAGTIAPRIAINQVATYTPTATTYNPTNHAWVRIRESAGTLYFETSPTGAAGSWTVLNSTATPTQFLNSTKCEIDFEGQISGGTAGDATWDNINLPPPSAVNAPAELAAATGAAQSATTKVSTGSGAAIGTGQANDATISTSASSTAGAASGTGAAYPATVSTSSSATAGSASGAGAALGATTKTSPASGVATATGAARDATVSVSSNASPTAGTATGVGAAQAATTKVSPTVGVASGTGAALGATSRVATGAGVATATGQARDASTTSSGAANAGVATGTGQARNALGTTGSTTAGVATGTGAARDATVSVFSGTDVPAGTAIGSGAALGATVRIGGSGQRAQGTGEALSATTRLQTGAGVAQGTGAARNASVAIVEFAAAERAQGFGQAHDATATALVGVNAQVAFSIGSALNATVTIVQSRQADPTPAEGTGEALDAGGRVRASIETATGAGQATDATVTVETTPSTATATGQALDASVATTASGSPETAEGAGAAQDAATALTVRPTTATAQGAAHDAQVIREALALAEVAEGFGEAQEPDSELILVGKAKLRGFGEIRAVEESAKVPDGVTGTIEVTFAPIADLDPVCQPTTTMTTACAPTADLRRGHCG